MEIDFKNPLPNAWKAKIIKTVANPVAKHLISPKFLARLLPPPIF